MNLGLLRLKRLAKRYSQNDISNLIDLSKSSYISKELGKVRFAERDIKAITTVLELSQNEVVEIFY